MRNHKNKVYPSTLVNRMSRMDTTLIQYLRYKVMEEESSVMPYIIEKAKDLTDRERELARPYLQLGTFANIEEDLQLSAYVMILEAEHKRELRKHIEANQRYTGEESIFNDTSLSAEDIVHGGDLINYDAIQRVPNTNIAQIGNRYARIDSRIPMVFYHWLEDCFANSPKSVHIDPYNVYDVQPSQMILECVIQPPKRDWWQTLNIYNGDQSGCSIILLGNDANEKQDYYDYNVLGIRKLQMSVRRQNGGNMQMMIEELTKIYFGPKDDDCYMIGRMIHLDTDAARGTDFHDATLNHIDLAENLYVGYEALERDDQDLAIDHRIIDATFRTHLLRVDNIPFESIFKFAYAFFKSKQLVDEWRDAEFC